MTSWTDTARPGIDVLPLSWRYEIQLGKMLDEKRHAGAELLPYLRNVNVQWGRIDTHDLKMMPFDPREQGKFALRSQDILVCEGGDVGRAAIVPDSLHGMYFQKSLHRLRPLRNDTPRFLFYALAAAHATGEYLLGANKSTIAHLTAEQLRATRFPFPPFDEQRRIADFLDRETARIDELVIAKQSLGLALRRRWIAGCIEACALPPGAGRARSRWKWLIRGVRGGLWGDEAGVGELDVPCVRVADFNRAAFTASSAPTTRSYAAAQARKLALRHGDLLLEKSGGGDQSPVGFVVRYEGNEGAAFSNFTAVLRPVEDVDSRWLWMALVANYMSGSSHRYINQTTGIQNLDVSAMLSQEVHVPSREEQARIADRLASGLRHATDLVAAVEESVARLTEYRRALITEAVTGQLNISRMSDAAAEERLEETVS